MVILFRWFAVRWECRVEKLIVQSQDGLLIITSRENSLISCVTGRRRGSQIATAGTSPSPLTNSLTSCASRRSSHAKTQQNRQHC